jgi:hypothetical protein
MKTLELRAWHENRNRDLGDGAVRAVVEIAMNALGALLTAVAVVVGVVVLLPLVGIGLAILFSLGGVLLWLLPIVIIAASDKVTTSEKVLWILAIVFLSWFAWILYFFFAPLFDRPEDYRYR